MQSSPKQKRDGEFMSVFDMDTILFVNRRIILIGLSCLGNNDPVLESGRFH